MMNEWMNGCRLCRLYFKGWKIGLLRLDRIGLDVIQVIQEVIYFTQTWFGHWAFARCRKAILACILAGSQGPQFALMSAAVGKTGKAEEGASDRTQTGKHSGWPSFVVGCCTWLRATILLACPPACLPARNQRKRKSQKKKEEANLLKQDM